MDNVLRPDFTNKRVDTIKQLHKRHSRKFNPDIDLLIFSQAQPEKPKSLSDELFTAIAFQNKFKLDEIMSAINPFGLMVIIESEQFLSSISILLDNKGVMKDMNKGIKLFYENFKKRLSRKIKNEPENTK